jgi:hypothetical protein
VRLVLLSASIEVLAGLVLIADPAVFAWLIFGGELSATGTALARLAGIALLTIGIACWPEAATGTPPSRVVRGLLVYNCLAAVYFAYVGVGPKLAGPLLWPAVALHAVLAVLFVRLFVSLKAA